jgi:hypothetical protein
MGLGVPEIDEGTIAQVFGDKSTMAASYVVDARKIGSQQLLQILRIEASR